MYRCCFLNSRTVTSCLCPCIALQVIEVLLPWRLSTNEVLATQIEVFEESQGEDDANMTIPGGVDLNSHQDVFSALFTKVCM